VPRSGAHEHAEQVHVDAAARHEQAAAYWHERGDPELAELERRNAQIERDAAALERDRARIERTRAERAAAAAADAAGDPA
jgi:hypothetical protein